MFPDAYHPPQKKKKNPLSEARLDERTPLFL